MNSLIVFSVEVQALLVTSPGSARLHESQCTQHLHNLFHECLTESRSLYEQRITVFFKLRFPREILRARRTGMEVTKAFPVLLDLLVTSPGSARLHESQCTQHLPNLFPDCFRSCSSFSFYSCARGQHGLSMGSAWAQHWIGRGQLRPCSAARKHENSEMSHWARKSFHWEISS